MKNELQVAEKLLQINAIKLNLQAPYTWASGWRSPIYCDNRKVLSYPQVREFIKSEMSNIVFQQFTDAEVVAGVATAGIPHGALIADQIKLPFIYVRSAPKGHGLGNQIEGVLETVVDVLRANGANVIGMVAIFTYGFPEATQLFADNNVPLVTLSNYESLLQLAKEKNMFTEAELATLGEWRNSPSTWMQ